MFTVYVIRSRRHKATLYVGHTKDLFTRLLQHNRGHVHTTAADRPWATQLEYRTHTRGEAVRLERQLKSFIRTTKTIPSSGKPN